MLTTARWTRYGKDRLYVKADDGSTVARQDLKTGVITVEREELRVQALDALAAEVARPSAPAPVVTTLLAEPNATVPNAVAPPVLPPVTMTWTDLALNQPGQGLLAEGAALRAAHPWKYRLARLLGIPQRRASQASRRPRRADGRRPRILAPAEFERLLACIPTRFLPLVLTEIETGLRWGELIALRPRHIDFLRRTFTVEETIVEVSKKVSPTGQRMIVKPYPKDDESRALTVSQELLDVLAARMKQLGLVRDDLLFPSTEASRGKPLSRNTFRTRVWLPALQKAELGFHVRMDDLRHAHASWLLAGGADLKSVMDRLGHSQIQTTQRYLHSLPGADEQALAAFQRIRDNTGR